MLGDLPAGEPSRFVIGSRASVIAVLLLAGLLGGCSNDKSPSGPTPGPTYLMGFSPFPPRPDANLSLVTIDLWSRRADAALILTEPPWDSLLAGRPPDALVRANQLGYANYVRARGLHVVV